MDEIVYLRDINFTRKIIPHNTVQLQIHGFCDASQNGYGAVVYIRATDSFKNHNTILLCSKSRVAPLKTITLPRLELCSALLLARLFDKVKRSLDLTFDKVFLWTDSTIPLTWISSTSSNWKTSVSNRVG